MNTTQSGKMVRFIAGLAIATGMATGTLGLAAIANASTATAPVSNAPTTHLGQQEQRQSAEVRQALADGNEPSSQTSEVERQNQTLQQAYSQLGQAVANANQETQQQAKIQR